MTMYSINRGVTLIRLIGICLTGAILISTVSCNGESDEERQLREAREWAIHTITEGETPPPKPVPLPSDLEVVMSPGIEGRFTSAKMKVYTYATDSYASFDVDIPGKAKVPGTDYTLEVLNYMPSWAIKDRVLYIRSSDEARPDPAIRCIVTDGTGKQVFNGFIFQLHKTPSFKTEKHVIGLVGVVEAGK